MSDRMRPIPFSRLMDGLIREYDARGTVFSVSDLYRHRSAARLPLFGESLELPLGPAAGPHTQLAQNLVAAYAAGARYFELKTVQALDGEDLPVEKPCILAEDEGYNVEWSTELRVPEAMDEYIKAWYAIKLIARAWGLGDPNGFAFNMSVGYDYDGIRSAKVDAFIEGLTRAGGTEAFVQCRAWAKANLHRLPNIDAAYLDAIDDRVSRSITLSTLHGCPPGEIERIAAYFIEDKRLNTFVKLNPTLIGYDAARTILDGLGYGDLPFDDHHFRGDLKLHDAVPMLRRLQARAAAEGVEFGVKLTNTFPVEIDAGQLPGREMYMSGKGLFPLSLAVASALEEAFDGALRVSFSGGADALNIARIFDAGIWPITLATTLLKPGGYGRLKPMAEALSAMPFAPFTLVDRVKLDALASDAAADPRYGRPVKPAPRPVHEAPLPLLDCFSAPCETGCPIHQDIPAYLALVSAGRYAEALRVILEKNPLPSITGTLCPHTCQARCARFFYEEPIQIRAAKLIAAERGMGEVVAALAPRGARPERVAVVGGGPGGMAAAFLLARAGAKVTLFERRGALGGVVRHAIPAFRIPEEAIDRDAALLAPMGVDVRLNTAINVLSELDGFTHVVVAIGAGIDGVLPLKAGRALPVMAFLEAQRRGGGAPLGERVSIVGGGNTAMDAARAAVRAEGVKQVSLVYRRTAREMPADAEEWALAQGDGVVFRALLAPVAHEDGLLRCEVMALGERGSDGRRRPEPTGVYESIPCDTVISAVGERVDADALARLGAARSGHVFVLGDARRGPATVVEAIADAAEAVRAILGVDPIDHPFDGAPDALRARRAALSLPGDPACEGDRCLGCSRLCGHCVDVCPNRANILIDVPGMANPQVLHLDARCNECGNCATFCPFSGAPYRDKFTVFESAADFEDSTNQGFLALGGARVRVRFAGQDDLYDLDRDALPDARLHAVLCAYRKEESR